MSDGTISIDIEVDGKQVNTASKELDQLGKQGTASGKGIKTAEDGLKGVGQESSRASGNVRKFATAIGLVAIASSAFKVLKSSLDAAISRFDTLNTFPKVLQELGVSAEESEQSMNKLSDGIDGLPTKLDEIASTAQRMYTSFNDMDKASDSAIALNNALLGSGSSADQARRGTEQYLKALQTGKVDMMLWNTLSETMDVGLVKIAESFGYAGRSAKSDLYQSLQSGERTIDDFNDKLIELGTGTGIMAKLAKENSLGLATSIGNLGTAVSRNVANMITKFDNLTKAVTGKNIAENIDGLKNVVNSAFKVIGNVIDGTIPIIVGFVDGVKTVLPVVKALSPALTGLASAWAIHTVINLATNAIKTNTAVVAVATAAKNTYAIATNRMTLALTLAAVKTKLAGLALAAYNKIIGLAVAAQALMTSGVGLASIATIGFSGAISILGTAIKILLGPVGWATAAVGLLVGAVVGIVKWFNRGTAEGKKLAKETEKLSDSTKELTDNVESSEKAYEKNQTNIEASAEANAELAKRIDELSRKENKSKADKEMLSSYVEQLNDSIDDLNLSYGEEADALNMTSEQLQARIELMREQEKANAGQERLTEILEEQYEAGKKLEEVNELQQEWNEKKEEGTVKNKEYKESIAELDEQEKELTETLVNLGEQQQATEQQIAESIENVTELTEQNIGKQIILFEDLSESQQETINKLKSSWQDYLDSATDMFDRLSDKSKLSIGEMQKNLEENQRIIGEWSENIAKLAERGVDEGLLEKLREAGPSSAGHVKALVKASDTELEKLSDTFAQGGQVATDALKESLGLDKSGALDSVEHLVVGMSKTMKQEIESANFDGMGADITDGLAGGVVTGTVDVEKAAKEMAKKTTDATKDEFGIQSPSTVYKEMGLNNTEGMVLGISSGTSAVIQSMRDLAKSSVNQFSTTPISFRAIGMNAMAGLNLGLISGRGRVLATARSIANSIASTMQKALDIHSPSRKTEKGVGLPTVQGVAVGIKENAKLVYNELDKLAKGMIRTSTPEVALGTYGMSHGNASNIFNNTNRSTTETKYNTVDMKGMFEGANFHIRDDQDIPKLAKELHDYQVKVARENGVVVL